MTELLEEVLRKVATLPRDEQDAIASQIIETLQDEAAWKEKLARAPEKLRRLAKEAQREHEYGETRPLDELLSSSRAPRALFEQALLLCRKRFKRRRVVITVSSVLIPPTPAFDSKR